MNFFTGFLIGVVSLIPGISGGTILVLMKKYEEVANAITHFRKKENLLLLGSLILGIFLGTVTFARIIELCFYFIPDATMILFSGFVLFNIPNFIKSEKIAIHPVWFLLGVFLIFFLSFFSSNFPSVVLDYPKITFLFLLLFSFYGAIDGFFTILPGISGSMVMMILGPYFLYKSFLANLSFQNIVFVFPLLFYFIGDIFGFYIGSKFSLFCLKKYRKPFLSLVLGMVIMSAFVILPAFEFDWQAIFHYCIPLGISFVFCTILNRFN